MQRNAFWEAWGEAGGMRRRQLELSCMNNVRGGWRSRWAECINFSAPKLERINSTNASGSPFSALTLNLFFPFIFFPRIPKGWQCFFGNSLSHGMGVPLQTPCLEYYVIIYYLLRSWSWSPGEALYFRKKWWNEQKVCFLGKVDCP